MDETLIHKVDASDKYQSADLYVDVPTEDNSKIVKVRLIAETTFDNETNSFPYSSALISDLTRLNA